MQQLKTFKLILCLAAIIFIARPFIGFSVSEQLQDKEETSVFVKIFSKRKPEFLEDAVGQLAKVKELLRDRASNFQMTFNALLATLFVQLAVFTGLLSRNAFHSAALFKQQPAPIYLLTRQLTI